MAADQVSHSPRWELRAAHPELSTNWREKSRSTTDERRFTQMKSNAEPGVHEIGVHWCSSAVEKRSG